MEKVQRRFGAGIGLWLREAVCEEGRTRSSLARGLCELADWRNAKGDLCLASARRALPALAADIGRLAENDRFLILPGVRVSHPASRVLALATARLADDWEAAHAM